MAIEWQLPPSVLPFVVAGLTSTAIAAFAAYRGRESDRKPLLYSLALVAGTSALWALTEVASSVAVSDAAKFLPYVLSHLAAFALPSAWLAFTLVYTDRTEWLTPWTTAALVAVPALATVGAVVNPFGTYVVRVVEVGGQFRMKDYEYGSLYWGLLVVAYGYLLVGMGLIVRRVTSADLYRGQVLALLGGVLVPLVVNVASNADLIRIIDDPTPVSFTATNLLFAYAIFRYRLLDVVPVARDAVVESMRDGYLVVDHDDRVVDANPAARSLAAVADPIGDDIDRVLGESVDLGTSDREELVTGEGDDRRFFEVDVSPLSDDDRSIGRLVTLRDVTDRRRVEKRYRALFEHASDVITVVDEEGTIQYQSPSIERVLGYDPEDLVGEDVFEYVHPDDRDRVVAGFREGIDDPGRTVRLEYRFRAADGDYRVVESVGRNLLDDPYVEGVAVTSRDVTDRVERERKLQEQNERLDQFASVVSHDLRNPLGVAQGYVDPAYDDPETYLPEIEQSLERMERIVEDVLALARQGEDVGDAEPTDLAVVARAAWDVVDTGDADLTVEETTTVRADPDRLQSLFENLFRNAVEHGGPSVRVRVGATGRGFFVADDGPGVDPEVRAEVFESGVTTAADGTGLGLAIVDRVADAHGWSVELSESADGGARFDVVVEGAAGDRKDGGAGGVGGEAREGGVRNA